MTLTREQILSMDPGRELDALVAEKVMGYIPVSENNWWLKPSSFNCEPSKAVKWITERKGGVEFNGKEYARPVNDRYFSTQISAAWEVVEKMRATHVYELADFGRDTYKTKKHYTAFHPINEPRDYERQVRAKTLPEAICKAALLATLEDAE